MRKSASVRWGLLIVGCVLSVVICGWAQGIEPAQSPAETPAQNSGQPPNPGQASSPGQEDGKELPDAPSEEKKGPSAKPVHQVEDKTKQVGEMTQHAATAGLIKARDWESTWIKGVYIGRDEPLISPTAKQRQLIYLQQTLTTPGAYMKRMFGAASDQARGVPGQWDDGWVGYTERFASREGQFITANTLAALGNAKLGYEVRYDKCKCDGAWPRTRHAIIRNFLTYDRSEEHLHPQWALYGGAFAGGLVATSWKPRSQNALTNGGYAVLGQVGYGTLLNL